MSIGPLFETMLQDLRYAARGLRRSPVFAITAVVAIALGTGAGTAVFSVIDRVLFRSLPYPLDDQLVSAGMTAPITQQEFLLGSDYIEWRDRQTPFQTLATMSGVNDCDLTEQRPLRASCASVDSALLRALQVQPLLGRNFTAEEDRPSGPRAAILSYGLWRSRFAADRAIVGKTISLDGSSATIVGVLAKDFELPTLETAEILVPEALDLAQQRRPNTGSILRAFARLKPGVTVDQAEAQLQPLFADSLKYVPPRFQKEIKLKVRSLRDRQTHDARLTSWLLLGSVIAVLLIACANVTNLLLARATGRQRELVVRSALGATRLRLARQALTESLLLGTLGGLAGFALAWLLLGVFLGMAPQGIPHIHQAGLDGRILGFTLALSLLCGALVGLVPALQVPRAEVLGGGHTIYAPRSFLRQLLVAGQIAVSLVLVTCAGLLLRSLWNLQRVPLGMETRQLTTASVVLGQQLYAQPAQRWNFFEKLEARLHGVPGSVAISDTLPLAPSHSTLFATIAVEGRPLPEKGTGGTVLWRVVSPEYFSALNIPILRGRGFSEGDRSSAENPVIISESLAWMMFSGEDALGKRIQPNLAPPWFTVIGVARDVKNSDLSSPSAPEYYFVRKHAADYGLGNRVLADGARYATVLVRSPLDHDHAAVSDWLRKEVAAIDPTLPVQIDTMDLRVRHLEQQPRFNAFLLTLFAAVGLLLALIGLYGVISFLVGQRTQEIGVRMALGATRGSIMNLVLSQAARWTALGVVVGAAGSLFAARLIRALLFEVPANDYLSLVMSVVLLFATALLAASVPSRRAATTDPLVALRHE
ncbi:MAG TPA: ABC transporter permease [Candidatus Angelobacter sp.]